MDKVDFVIFDMDGLLFDTETIAFQAFKKALAKHDYHFTMDIFKQMLGLPPSGDEKILQTAFGDDFQLRMIEDDFEAIFQSIIEADGVQIKHGTRELLDELDQKNIKRCIASSSSLETIESYLTITNLTDRFDFFISGDEVENGKPHPDIFLEACRRANAAPERSLVLEDSFHGFMSAHSAGINCIVVPDIVEPNEKMQKHAYRVVDHLGEVIDLV